MLRTLHRAAWYFIPLLAYITMAAMIYAFAALVVQVAWVAVASWAAMEAPAPEHHLEGWALYLPALAITLAIMPGRVRGAFERVPPRPPDYYPGTTDGITYAGAIRHQQEDQ